MLIVDDKRLPPGIDYATAVALMKPEDSELVVHIVRELGPSVYTPTADAGGHVIRHTHDAETAVVEPVPTKAPTVAPPTEGVGLTFAKLELLAAERRMTLLRIGDTYALQGKLGQKFYPSLSAVADAMRHHRY